MKSKALLLTVGVLLCSASFALATPITGSLSAGVTITHTPDDAVSATDSDDWSGTPGALAVSATAVASNPDTGEIYGQTSFNGSAGFAADGNSGFVLMNYGWSGTSFNRVVTNLDLPNWSYRFTADANGLFSLTYQVAGSGDTFGLWGFSLVHDFASGTGAPVTSPYDPTSSGTFVGSLIAGETYTVYLSNNGNLQFDGYTNSGISGSVDAQFKWNIEYSNSVPDTGATLAFLGLAFASLVGLRRKF